MLVQRVYLERLVEELDKPYISILVGPRQVGKSTLMQQLGSISKKRGKRICYLNLEDPRDLSFFHGTETEILSKLEESGDVIFIDEFQYLKNATKLFKIIYDADKKIKIVASGSSAIEIHKHLKESLAGRYRKTQIFPLTLKEAKQPIPLFYVFGGLPGLLHEPNTSDKMELLNNIVQAYLLKDIKSLIREENVRAFNHLLYLIAQAQGSPVSVASLAREIGLTEPAIHNYLEIMAQTYVCHAVDSYSKNMANELKKSKKYYLFDLGIRNSLLSDFSELEKRKDRGVLAESFVALTLISCLKANMQLKFWRTRQGDEVDFILLKNRIPYPIEVKWRFSGHCPRGLALFLKKYPEAAGGAVISEQEQSSIIVEGRTVQVISFSEVNNLSFLKDE